MQHQWTDGKCSYCRASQKALDRGAGFETHAYAFIHTNDIKTRIGELFGDDMQFDVIIGNPPYQLDDGGHGSSAAPIYQLFVEKALDLDPRYAVFVTPSRWMAGGKGLDKYRARMLSDKRMRAIVDYPKLYEGFPGVKIRGGERGQRNRDRDQVRVMRRLPVVMRESLRSWHPSAPDANVCFD